MATKTTNYNLVKPAGKEKVSIDVLNGNMDAIDQAMKGLDDRTVTVANNLTTEEEGSALDAVQGKVLADRVDRGLSEIASNIQLEMNKRVPAGGIEGQILKSNGDETSQWEVAKAEEITVTEATRTLYGLSTDNANVDDALKMAHNGDNIVLVDFNLCYPNSTEPVPGTRTFTITSADLYKPISIVTANKVSSLISLAIGTYTITPGTTVGLPFDVAPKMLTLTSGQGKISYNLFNWATDYRITSSTSIPVTSSIIASKISSIDVYILGGGGGGGGSNSQTYASGGGGGGGYVTRLNLPPTAFSGVSSISATIGSGGSGGASNAGYFGGTGGTTSLTIGGNTYTGAGGKGGFNNGVSSGFGVGGDGGSGGGAGGFSTGAQYNNGANGGTNGSSGGTNGGSSYTGIGSGASTLWAGVAYGAGGGGGGSYVSGVPGTPGNGGANGGGKGIPLGVAGSPYGDATNYGGGGGGHSSYQAAAGGNGYQGMVALRFNPI